jgi:hypothetical protein
MIKQIVIILRLTPRANFRKLFYIEKVYELLFIEFYKFEYIKHLIFALVAVLIFIVIMESTLDGVNKNIKDPWIRKKNDSN